MITPQFPLEPGQARVIRKLARAHGLLALPCGAALQDDADDIPGIAHGTPLAMCLGCGRGFHSARVAVVRARAVYRRTADSPPVWGAAGGLCRVCCREWAAGRLSQTFALASIPALGSHAPGA